MADTKPIRRPIDRQRRQRILDATLQVIAEGGMTALSHRRVARTAGVTLSATSYYFGTLDDLIEEAFDLAVERDLERFARAIEQHRVADDPVTGLAKLADQLGQDSGSGLVALELCVAAVRTDALKPIMQRWDDGWRELLEPHLGPRGAAVACTLIIGIAMRASASADGLTLEEITDLVRAALGERP